MESIFVLFFASDIDYARALIHGINELDKSIFFELYDGRCLILDELNTKMTFESTDLVLVEGLDEEKVMYLAEKLGMNPDLWIVEKQKKESFDCEDCKEVQINKYLSADVFLRYINHMYNKKYQKRRLDICVNSCQYVYFCSSSGGTGKTTVALGLAQELVRYHGKKVLYINYEEFDSSYKYMPQKEGFDLEFLMVSKSKKIDLSNYLLEDVYGVKYFNMGDKKNPLKCMDSRELFEFLDIINESIDFEYILIDGTEKLDEVESNLIKECHSIFQIEVQGREKIAFSKYLKQLLGTNLSNKIIYVRNFSAEEEWERKDGIIYIEYDSKIFYEKGDKTNMIHECCKINIDGEFGMGVKEMSRSLTLI